MVGLEDTSPPKVPSKLNFFDHVHFLHQHYQFVRVTSMDEHILHEIAFQRVLLTLCKHILSLQLSGIFILGWIILASSILYFCQNGFHHWWIFQLIISNVYLLQTTDSICSTTYTSLPFLWPSISVWAIATTSRPLLNNILIDVTGSVDFLLK